MQFTLKGVADVYHDLLTYGLIDSYDNAFLVP